MKIFNYTFCKHKILQMYTYSTNYTLKKSSSKKKKRKKKKGKEKITTN